MDIKRPVVNSRTTSHPKPTGTAKSPIQPAQRLHNRTDRAHTLMRGALKKPSISVGPKIQRLNPINAQRDYRAKATPKHSHVDRFGVPTGHKTETINAHVTPRHTSARAASPQSQTTATAVMPSMVTSASHQKLERMLDQALTRADAHKQALRYHAARHFWQRPGFLGRRTGLKVALIGVSVVLAIGFIAWQKFPQLSVRLASSQAHISASVPSYIPEGYKLASPAKAQDGTVLMSYVAPEGPGYSISQKQSDLTGASLAQNIVPPGAQVQTTQVAGNTIYIYGSSNDAAWVNNGILYTITDHAGLNSDQIIKIVQGLN